MGSDVEWGWGLGAVQVTLVECDPETNREIQSDSPIAATISQGYNSKMEPMLSSGGGVYRLVNIKVDRSYAVKVEAPDGYLFTNGICNDDERGWECEYTRASGRNLQGESQGWFHWPSKLIEGYEETEEGGWGIARGWFSTVQQWTYRGIGGQQGRRLATDTSGSHAKDGNKSTKAYAVGITSGRSSSCIAVDRFGIPDQSLDLGVMRIGDSKAAETDVALVLDFDDAVSSQRSRKRGLKEMIADATELPRDEHSNVRRYLLAEKDKNAIGSVTAEVLASRLDKRLAENQVVLDAVVPQDVIISAHTEASSKEVAVALNIQGHYSPPPELDFDYIVNDSINSDTDEIRRSLREYNQNCRDQTAKIQSGSSMSDFNEIYSLEGSISNRGGGAGGDVYRTVCAEGETLPAIFETSLKEIQATKVSEVAFHQVIYEEEEARLDSWALGPLAAVSGLIALLMGIFIFRRALGPRKVDHYRKAMKTRNVDGYERRRFGEMGGDLDDGSVDSAFYSDADEDDFKEGMTPKSKERRMRRKLKEIEKKAGKGAGKSSRKFGKSTRKMVAMAKSSRSLAVKSGSADETDSVPSGDSPKDAPDEKRRCKEKRDAEPCDSAKKSSHSSTTSARRSSIHSSTTSTRRLSIHSSTTSVKSESLRSSATSNKSKESSKKSSSRRGRDKREGGDNARIIESELKKSID
eukprot:CCRYP_009765-RD/>CCRYP_009765-RD protein AED:0.17 eAED:0.17 QI:465/1/1/1/0.71/0.62/8/239/692